MKINIIIAILIMFLATGCSKADVNGSQATGKGGSLARFTIVGNRLYIVDRSDLKVFDITIPSKPIWRNTTSVGFEIETIFPFRDRLFIGSSSVVHIFSIEDPDEPERLSTASSPQVFRRCDPVVAKDTVAYATLRMNNTCGGTQSILAVYDIKDIMNPIHVNSEPIPEPYGLGYAENALYVCDKSSLWVFDIANAYRPQLIKRLAGEHYYDVIADGNTLVCWTESGLTLFDISEKLHPKLVKRIK